MTLYAQIIALSPCHAAFLRSLAANGGRSLDDQAETLTRGTGQSLVGAIRAEARDLANGS